MAHKKAQGSTTNGRDSVAKRLGVKLYDGEIVKAGQVIIRQRGSKWHAGKNVRVGGDDTLYAAKDGKILFNKKKAMDFTGALQPRVFVNVVLA